MAGCGSELADAGTDLPGAGGGRTAEPIPVRGRSLDAVTVRRLRWTAPMHAGTWEARYLHTMHTRPTVVGCRPTRHAADCER